MIQGVYFVLSGTFSAIRRPTLDGDVQAAGDEKIFSPLCFRLQISWTVKHRVESQSRRLSITTSGFWSFPPTSDMHWRKKGSLCSRLNNSSASTADRSQLANQRHLRFE